MYRESVGPDLEDILMNDQNLFEYSPAESLINFELPPAAAGNHWQFDELDFSSDAFVSSASERNHDDLNITSDFPVLFDFADFDNSVDLDEYILQALSDDHSDVLLTSNESADSGDDTSSENISGNAIDADSMYGPSTSELFTGTLGVDWEINSAVTVPESNEKKLYSWGTPEYCERLGAFRCPVESCGKLYAKVSHVRAHLRRHSGEKPYVCTWTDCAWRFARSDELARHRRSHSGDKPYRCSECSKRFARSDHLTKHGRVHARRRAAAAAAASVSKRCTVTAGPRSRRLLV